MSTEETKILVAEKERQCLLHKIGGLFTKIVEENKSLKGIEENSDEFQGIKVPKIQVHEYILRLSYYFKFEKSTIIIAIIYMDRFCLKNQVKIKYQNFYRLFLTAIVLAIKYNEDVLFKNLVYSRIGGVSIKNLNNLEALFCEKIDYLLYVSYKEYDCYLRHLNGFSQYHD